MYKTMTDFGGLGIIPLISAIVTAVPVFFPLTLFVLWLSITGASYFTILKTTGKKRFWNSLTASSFIIFLVSLIVATMNTSEITFLSGYWVGFYILAVILSWYALVNYK